MVLRSILFLLIIGSLSACSLLCLENSEIIGTWKLTEMAGSFSGSTTTGTDMEWQETYIFKYNGTFIKTRVQNDTTTDAKGTYEVINSENDKIVELTYEDHSPIIGSCFSSQLKEELFFESDHILFSSWNACDGPGLKYEKQ